MNVLKAPFLFLMIRFPGRLSYVLLTPLVGSLLTTALVTYLSPKVHVLGPSGLFTKLLAIMPIAGGFFVAALTVILSQSNSVLQSGFVGDSKPYLLSDDEPMTRQRFLALLFGYLSFSSFSITGIAAGVDFIAPALKQEVSLDAWNVLKYGVTAVVSMWTAQMFTCSLIGLFYLTDRLYRSDKVAKFSRLEDVSTPPPPSPAPPTTAPDTAP